MKIFKQVQYDDYIFLQEDETDTPIQNDMIVAIHYGYDDKGELKTFHRLFDNIDEAKEYFLKEYDIKACFC